MVHGSGVLCLLGHEGPVNEVMLALVMEMRTEWGWGTHGYITDDSVRRHFVLQKSLNFMEQKSFTTK